MFGDKKRSLVLILITILTGLTGLVASVASNQFPKNWQPYLWLAWPLFGLLLLLSAILLIWQQRLKDDSPSPIPSTPSIPLEESSLFDVFISYSHADKKAVAKLINRLRTDGFTLWIDEEQIGGGDPLRQAMTSGIKQSQHVMCCLSISYLISKWGTFESAVNQALDPDNRNRRLIPVKIAAVDIPPEYKWLYCPDLTNSQTWEQEYQKATKHLRRTQNQESHEDKEGSDESSNYEEDQSTLERGDNTTFETEPPTIEDTNYILASPSLRLQALGFEYDPFAYPEAERMPAVLVEATFVAPPGFDEDVMDLNRSAALFAQPGGGKTAGLRRLETFLLDRRRRSFSGTLADERPPVRPLVVTYNTFGKVIARLPGQTINTQDHAKPLLAAIAEAVWEFISAYPVQFLALELEMQKQCVEFMVNHLYGRPPIHRIRDQRLMEVLPHLLAGVQRADSEVPLEHALEQLLHVRGPLLALGLDSMFILVDGIDGYENQSLSDLAAFITPLLIQRLLSIPGVIWKCFLPDILGERVAQLPVVNRQGRLRVVPIHWDNDEDHLINFLQARLKWASNNSIVEMANICESDLIRDVNIEKELAQMALRHHFGPPRALLELARRLFHWQTAQMGDHLITRHEWEDFQIKVQEELEQNVEALLIDEDKLTELVKSQYQNLNQQVKLAKSLEESFNLDELSGLCAHLGIHYDNLEGGTLQRKTKKLVKYLYRRGRLSELILLLQKELRPFKKWR